MDDKDHSPHHHLPSKKLLIGAGVTGGLILAPYLLPLIGIGDSGMTARIARLCSSQTGLGTGLAGGINTALSSVPGIGPGLAAGGWTSALTSGIIGFGGALLGNYISRHYDRPGQIPWGKIIRYASLATSILIALPSILSGVSMGIAFLAFVLSGEVAVSATLGFLKHKLGFMGSASMVSASASAAGLLPHLFTCGASTIPLIGSLFASGHAHDNGAIEMKLVSASPVIPGQPCHLAFQLRDGNGKPLCPDDLATVHTKKLHTMIVDASLTDYQHVHPLYNPATKLFTCEFTPMQAQPYRAWHDVTRATTGERTYLSNDLPGGVNFGRMATIRQNSQVTANDITATIRPDAPLRAGADAMLAIDLRGPTGESLRDLEPIMGSFAHLVAFSQDGKHMIHCHAMGTEPASDSAQGDGKLQFHVTPDVAGGTQFFLQVKRNGRELVIPFGQQVMPNLQFTQRVASAPHQHGAMAMG